MTTTSSERRLNLLTGDWVLVSPHRQNRPWHGAKEGPGVTAAAPSHDPACHLCPGALRANGVRNPDYAGVHVFTNDFPALTANTAHAGAPDDPLFVAEPEGGECRVICYSPDHGLPMSRMAPQQVEAIIDVWAGQFTELAARQEISAVTIFENRGEAMGASNPHPHGQMWATQSIPNELAREDERQRAWLTDHGEPLLTAYLARELAHGERIVEFNDAFVALVPFWASWPFETLVLPRRAMSALDQLHTNERAALAQLLCRLTAGYDALFDAPFPYSMGFHQRPTRGEGDHFVMHAHFYPPLRAPAVRKFMVGFEMLAMAQRDLTPEAAADQLRATLGAIQKKDSLPSEG